MARMLRSPVGEGICNMDQKGLRCTNYMRGEHLNRDTNQRRPEPACFDNSHKPPEAASDMLH